MGRKNVGLIIDVMNHNFRTGKVNPDLMHVTQAVEVPEHLQAEWDKMAGKSEKAGAKKTVTTPKKATAKKTAPVKKATVKKSIPTASKAAPASQAPHETARGLKLTALALAYAKTEAGNLFNNNDGAEDVAADEVIDHILATKGKPGEDEDSFDRDAIEACLNTAFEEFDNILESSFGEDE